MGLKNLSISTADIDRNKLYLAGGAVALILAFALGYGGLNKYKSFERKVAAKKEEIKKFKALEEEYLRKKSYIESFTKKAYSSGTDSIINLIEGIGNRAGVKERIVSIKPLEEKEVMGYRQKGAEVRIEKIDLNQLINLLYLIENNRSLLVIKEFSMKSRFEDPNLIDVTINLAQLSKVPS